MTTQTSLSRACPPWPVSRGGRAAQTSNATLSPATAIRPTGIRTLANPPRSNHLTFSNPLYKGLRISLPSRSHINKPLWWRTANALPTGLLPVTYHSSLITCHSPLVTSHCFTDPQAIRTPANYPRSSHLTFSNRPLRTVRRGAVSRHLSLATSHSPVVTSHLPPATRHAKLIRRPLYSKFPSMRCTRNIPAFREPFIINMGA